MKVSDLSRRHFLQLLSAVAAGPLSGRASNARDMAAPASQRVPAKLRKPYVAIQVGAVSFVDEGIETVLDILREKAHVNTVWLNTYTWDHGTGGRQLAGFPFPDHGPQDPDEVRGGAVFDYDQKYFRHTILNQLRTSEYQGRNILAEVLPKARERTFFLRDVASVGEVKSLSPNDRFVIALHSPSGLIETGLPLCPPEKKARNLVREIQ